MHRQESALDTLTTGIDTQFIGDVDSYTRELLSRLGQKA